MPAGVVVICQEGQSIFDAGTRAGVAIPTACNAKATCGLCRVKVLAGAENLPPINKDETKHLGNTYFITKLRLSCQCKVGGDVTVELPQKR